LHHFRLLVAGTSQGSTVDVIAQRHGKPVKMLYPEKRVYRASEQATSEIAIRSTLKEDLYVVFAGLSEDEKAVIQVYLNPLVSWLWIGGLVIGLGTIICILPESPTGRVRGKTALDRLLSTTNKV